MKRIATIVFISLAISSFGQAFIKNSIRSDKPGENLLEQKGSFDDWFKVQEVNLYGGGGLLSLVTTKDIIDEATSTTGSIGLNFVTKRISNDLYFSYNGKQSIEIYNLSVFGNTLMNPNLSGQSISYSIFARVHKIYGVSCSIQLSDQLWKLDSISTFDASPFFFRIGGYFRPFNFTGLSDNLIDLTFNIHYTHRSILGDFNNRTQNIDGQAIEPRGYNGFDISGNFYFNSVQLIVQFSQNLISDFEIPGFSGSQITFGINVTGEMLKLK